MKVEQIQEILRNDFLLKPPKPPSENKGIIKLVDLMVTQNAAKHNTSMFALVTNLKTPIFRRGQQFSLRIEFKEKFELTKENLRLDFFFGSDPLPGNGTLNQLKVPVTVSKTLPESKGWGVCVTSKESKSLNLEVKPSPACPVGIWFLTIVTEPNKQAFNVPQHMYILFNPWCKADLVYMENDNWRKEYVLNDKGLVYKNQGNEQPWNIKQFQSVTLTAALYLLEFKAGAGCETKHGERGLPAKVCRATCWLDREHVLLGQWGGPYKNGKHPCYWTGSLEILEHFMKNKEIAKYGQCWCFAGIRLSLFRALGIPCRATSIYNAAVESTGDVFIDTIWDFSSKDKVKHPERQGEKIWNFHVWNNVWMLRTDLHDGYGGWQVADGRGVPMASLAAVKKGEVGLEFNTKGVFSEVNGDEIISHKLSDGSTVIKEINESSIGYLILTKAVGEYKRQNVTLEHKFPEGSKEERAAVLNAAKINNNLGKIPKLTPTSSTQNDVFFTMKIETKMIGQPITISVQIENRGNDKRGISFTLGAHSVEYTGKICHQLNVAEKLSDGPQYKKFLYLVPAAQQTVTVIIKPEMYVEKLCNFAYIRIFAAAHTDETKQVWTKMETISVKTPKLTLDMPDDLVIFRKSIITVTFTNPLPKELTGCSLHVEGSCQSVTEMDAKEMKNVMPNETVTILVEFSPEGLGSCVVSAVFNSNLLTNVAASKTVNVAEKLKN